ncbi:biliverdin-producing heme oxygenase [Nocardioides dongkuii]|uniref:biliverdin-producing heme oxygenase n=1 Tax=Nocardioides dongkuii TaxID=2760089 RepID=UPI001878ADB2|nr:biliverdin-producing heme oxygenase [Nocardioides dongkuii]
MTVLDAGPAAPALSVAMREGSKTEHEDAEGSTFMAELLDGRISEAGYAAYLRRLRVVYAAMEPVLRDRRDDPLVAAVHDPALERLAAIDADLDHWAPGEPRELDAGDSPAAAAYRARLEGADWGGALVAHHYTRYLGDLSGGQAIGRVLDRAFELDGAGTAFYAFPEIPKPKPYKDAYRARLDALGLPREDVDRVVVEVKTAFRLNQGLFTELGEQLDRYRRLPA